MFRELISNELFTILLLVCLAFVATAKLMFEKRFLDFIWILTNSKYLKIYTREQKFFDRFDGLLFINLIISSAIFLSITYPIFFSVNLELNIDLLFKVSFGIGVFILIKVLIERLIGSLFDIDDLIDKYIFQKTSYKNFIGLFLIPINAILIYSLNPNRYIIYSILIILLILFVIGIITSFKAYQSLIKRNFFYFILYLCALEISPYIILYYVFINY